jgi:type II secretory pathway component PulF
VPHATRTSSLEGTVFRVAIPFILWVLLGIGLLLVVPQYKREFDSYGILVPKITQATIDVSMWLADYWLIAVILFVPLLLLVGVLTYVIRHYVRNRALNAVWLLILFGLPILCHAIVWYSLMLPRYQPAQ